MKLLNQEQVEDSMKCVPIYNQRKKFEEFIRIAK